MKTLILNQYAKQSFIKRLIGNTLTGLGWGFWIYLWVPLFTAIMLLSGTHPEQATSEASRSILRLLSTLISHGSMVIVMIGVFLTWSLLQVLGKRYRWNALQKGQVKWVRPASPSAHTGQSMQRWQQTQCMVVSHDDASGSIQQVETLKPKSKVAIQQYPVTYLLPVPPNSAYQFDSIARSVR
ncbi:poly-beta-1,6-N-acetyl-D-glucosamine biosynthesis protein PgaD [Methyloglobulus sp.]|jgi:poly-beta-1,6-N-acetyl-D-glucosamine biosynthesis protein PgaD|uniref:poly-beta-1,6-N-acetyl-D-glucosamine biosynthesis protein PgaD n=1 Tax=Methyloglobulus sp. TaxID=2518622 RepID=UPI0032B7091B